MLFHSTGPHYCPECRPLRNHKGRRIDQPLDLVESNYSGCGVDIAQCPTCGKTFQISYKVAEIIRIGSDDRVKLGETTP